MPTVLHLLSRFNFGGTERQLVERLRRHPRGFEAILACSAATGAFLDPIRALGIGLDIARFDALSANLEGPLPIRPGDFPVAVVGNLWPVKGHGTLVEAAALLRDRAPQVRFLCVGEGVMRPVLERRIRELGIEDRVLLLGHRTDVPAILARSSAFALCSSNEGLANAIMEAMAARLPAVATRVGGNPELLADGRGLLVPYGDPRSLADSLVRILADRAQARAMGLRGRAFIEGQLSLARMQSDHEALYCRALGLSP